MKEASIRYSTCFNGSEVEIFDIPSWRDRPQYATFVEEGGFTPIDTDIAGVAIKVVSPSLHLREKLITHQDRRNPDKRLTDRNDITFMLDVCQEKGITLDLRDDTEINRSAKKGLDVYLEGQDTPDIIEHWFMVGLDFAHKAMLDVIFTIRHSWYSYSSVRSRSATKIVDIPAGSHHSCVIGHYERLAPIKVGARQKPCFVRILCTPFVSGLIHAASLVSSVINPGCMASKIFFFGFN